MQSTIVSVEQLKELRNLCKTILDKVNGKRFYISDEDFEKNGDYYKDCEKEMIFDSSNLTHDKRIWNYKVDLDDETLNFIKEYLEPSGGFFFGSTEIDGGYFYDLIKTVLMLERALENVGDYDEFFYQASWKL